MIDFTQLKVGDYVCVEYTSGRRMKGGQIHGILTKLWTPDEHGAGGWQGQINDGWCFHVQDLLLEHKLKEA